MDAVVEAVFPNIRRLLKIYIIIQHSEAVVERMFSKIGLRMTKKQCPLEEKSLDMLMRTFLMMFDKVFGYLEM